MLKKGVNKFWAQTAVFLVSAFFHEVNKPCSYCALWLLAGIINIKVYSFSHQEYGSTLQVVYFEIPLSQLETTEVL